MKFNLFRIVVLTRLCTQWFMTRFASKNRTDLVPWKQLTLTLAFSRKLIMWDLLTYTVCRTIYFFTDHYTFALVLSDFDQIHGHKGIAKFKQFCCRHNFIPSQAQSCRIVMNRIMIRVVENWNIWCPSSHSDGSLRQVNMDLLLDAVYARSLKHGVMITSVEGCVFASAEVITTHS